VQLTRKEEKTAFSFFIKAVYVPFDFGFLCFHSSSLLEFFGILA